MPDILDILSSLFSPEEAEAAGARTPSMQMQMLQNPMLQQRMQEMRLQEQAGQIMLRELLRQQAARQDPLKQLQLQQAQQRVAEGEAKARPKPSIAELLRDGGATAQPMAASEDIIFRGTTPETGTPFFTNYPAGLPEWVSPEERQQFTQRFEAARAQAVPQPTKARDQDLDLLAKVGTALEKAGVPADLRSTILTRHFPGYKPEKELTPEQTGKLWKFNTETKDFDPVPPELTGKSGKELQALGYRTYSDKQRLVVDELKDVNVAFQQLRSAVKDISTKSAVELKLSQMTGGNVGGPEGAVYQKATTNFTTIFDKFLGGVRGAASPQMQEIRSKVLPSIISTGQVSDRLMGDLEELITAMGDSRLKSVVGGEAFKAADIDKQAQKVLNTFNKETTQAPIQRGTTLAPERKIRKTGTTKTYRLLPGAALPAGWEEVK